MVLNFIISTCKTEFAHSNYQSQAKSNLIYKSYGSWTPHHTPFYKNSNVIWKVNTSSIFNTFPNTLYFIFLIIILKKCNIPVFPSSPTSSFPGHCLDAIIYYVCQDMKVSGARVIAGRGQGSLQWVVSRGLKEFDGHRCEKGAWTVMSEGKGSVN